ncbi:MAG: hypothetical protein EOP33_08220, partial [Rickettsiaceae bacterium]
MDYKNFKIKIYYLLVLVGFFSLMFYNQFVFLPKILVMKNLLLVASLPNKNLETQKAFDFVKILDSKIQEIPESTGSKVSFFDLTTGIKKFYDQKRFNEVLIKSYYSLVVAPVVNYNDFYFRLNMCLDTKIRESNFFFYKNIFSNYHFLSWFFKSLRKSEYKYNNFDLNIFLDIFPKAYLSYVDSDNKVDVDKHIDFILGYLHILQISGIIMLHSGNKISFDLEHNINKSQELINFSFESLIFGVDPEYLNKEVDYDLDINFFIKNNNEPKAKDYVFNYIIASFTDYINYDNYSNNLYLDHD